MAKLPTYDAKQGLSTEAATTMRSMETEAQFGKSIAQAGQAVSEVAKVWQDAEDFSQTLTQRNYMEKGVQNVLMKVEAEPDYKNSAQYYDDLETIRNGSLEGFTNNQARMQFSAEVNTQINSASIKMDGMFRTKEIEHTKGELITAGERYKNYFIKDGNQKWQQKYLEELATARNKGFVNEVFTATEEVKAEDWKKLRYIQMAQDGDVKGALALVQQSDMSPTDKSSATASIMSVAKQGLLEIELKNLQTEQTMIKDAYSFMSEDSNEDGSPRTYVQKLEFIQDQKDFGLPPETTGILEKYLDSENKEIARTYDETKAAMIRSLGAFESGIGGDKEIKDIKEFLIRVKNTRLDIMKEGIKGRLTKADEKQVLNKLDDYINTDNTIAANKIKSYKRMGTPSYKDYLMVPALMFTTPFFDYTYEDAYKTFMTNFNDNTANAEVALVEFFNQTYDKKLSKEEKKQLTIDITKGVRGSLRQMIRDRLISENPELKNIKTESEASILKRTGFTEADIEKTIRESGVTREQVINRLRGK